MNTSKN